MRRGVLGFYLLWVVINPLIWAMSIVTLLKILVYGLGILAESLGIWASTSRHRYRRREVRGSGLREVRGFRIQG